MLTLPGVVASVWLARREATCTLQGSRPSSRRSQARSQASLQARKKSGHFPDQERAKLEPIQKEHLVEPHAVKPEVLFARVSEFAMRVFRNTLERERLDIFLSTVQSLLTLTLSAEGGAGFVCAPIESYDYLKEIGVDVTVVDASKKFPDGYMTQQLSEDHIGSFNHRNQVRDFTRHTSNDKWPEGHEAAHLPKDGYTLYGGSGFCRLAAARLVGLPVAGCEWERVGMRHTTALQVCWALRGHVAVVAVRSDSGKVHVLCPGEKIVEVLVVER